MNNLNHAKYIIVWRRNRSGDVQIEEYLDIDSAMVRREVLANLSYVNPKTITLYRQQEIEHGEEITRVVRSRPDLNQL